MWAISTKTIAHKWAPTKSSAGNVNVVGFVGRVETRVVAQVPRFVQPGCHPVYELTKKAIAHKLSAARWAPTRAVVGAQIRVGIVGRVEPV
ncbi:hypothetical protein GCM10009304_32830 [Pseudomonas matsuisoli]|uniref:Uncharacterized protein n=1 Tax=Pseudomonas matsuisoli TaxID=1515666 RepID=A0A917Q0T9_9PSED|nr:hypothetical protein GCM10009304_32830 [Pseudomonas matsuisoli]